MKPGLFDIYGVLQGNVALAFLNWLHTSPGWTIAPEAQTGEVDL
jgi:hypothetical protein